MQTNSPGAMRSVMSSSATTRSGPLEYSLRSPMISIAAPRRSTAIDLFPPRMRRFQRQPASLLSLFSSTNGGSLRSA